MTATAQLSIAQARALHVAVPPKCSGDRAAQAERVLVVQHRRHRIAEPCRRRLDGKLVEHRTAMDTVVLFPNERAFEMTWRAIVPVPRKTYRLEGIQVHEKRIL